MDWMSAATLQPWAVSARERACCRPAYDASRHWNVESYRSQRFSEEKYAAAAR
jgi:hypothetical protein